MIKDLLIREYLKTMLDDKDAESFAAWRRERYEAAGIDPKRAELHPKQLVAGRYRREPGEPKLRSRHTTPRKHD